MDTTKHDLETLFLQLVLEAIRPRCAESSKEMVPSSWFHGNDPEAVERANHEGRMKLITRSPTVGASSSPRKTRGTPSLSMTSTDRALPW